MTSASWGSNSAGPAPPWAASALATQAIATFRRRALGSEVQAGRAAARQAARVLSGLVTHVRSYAVQIEMGDQRCSAMVATATRTTPGGVMQGVAESPAGSGRAI